MWQNYHNLYQTWRLVCLCSNFYHLFSSEATLLFNIYVCLCIYPSICPSVSSSVCLCEYLSVRLSVCPSVCLSVLQFVYLSLRPPVRTSVNMLKKVFQIYCKDSPYQWASKYEYMILLVRLSVGHAIYLYLIYIVEVIL